MIDNQRFQFQNLLMDLLKPARDEIRLLEKTIADSMTRLNDLRAFVEAGDRLYGASSKLKTTLKSAESSLLAQPLGSDATPSRTAAPEQYDLSPRASKASQIVARVEWALELAASGHMKSKELVGVLQDHGIDLGAKPIGSLSVYLSKSGRFVSERAKGGWALKQQPRKEEPP
jgi:hypothetical protein